MTLTWQKSSFSGGSGSGECVELAAGRSGTVHLRESDNPTTVLTADAAGLAALLKEIKSGGFDRAG
ncbi:MULTISPECIES: DUF397 domain-containing protein [Streptomycetaceae]|uniref:DUF397 domain-containing protein n=1 Tax=Streptantibioticus cattleyicolor (strain ATCC 35852 / DSM 46488 / JCM 4925 / NBRC 14057 / NRRL 8057) TaxID=1003195 RepID=F8JXF9_STREN|nr:MULTISPECIES: DUF397 domain-containing protein [Streptomycetaceae]AEW95840.1 hypothetical protein SCATT_34690 [Streptantibioticus cattleyicolor NRRL 8057 = DSM 46488]MYS60383.1 DUF397 domain-containing protein [Streptomyces sp. SID5468]CCB76178.1 conserved protein of unknown function [Streptantibioticus cattleyicolor NRRL 8057 = DSM 46488]